MEKKTTETEKPPTIYSLLEKKYPRDRYALLYEVRDNAGFGASRSADAIAMGLWPSRGLELEGFEIKSFRGDWLGELKNPRKAEAIFQFCDRWWLVADGENIVKKEELPKTWGFIERRGNKLHYVVAAPTLTPAVIDRGFLAALLKRATQGTIYRDEIHDQLKAEYQRGAGNEKSRGEMEIERLRREAKDLRESIRVFEEKSGVHISQWDNGKIGSAVNHVLNGGRKKILDDLKGLETASERLHTQISQTVSELISTAPEERNNE